jgi:hypothetical protein
MPESGDLKTHDVQAVEQVFAKSTSAHELVHVAVGRLPGGPGQRVT